MKILFFVLCLLALNNTTFAGTDIQNGGGGLVINGTVATFYSAKISIDPEPMEMFEDIQNLNKELFHLQVTPNIKFTLLSNTTPSDDRRYFKATDSNSKIEIEKIKEEYMKITGLSEKEIVLFAITNVANKTTVLLPDFFKLNPIEKMAILFHESMWLSLRVNSLPDMLRLEYVFQQYLENKSPKNTFEFYRSLETTFDSDNLLLKAVAQSEIVNYYKTPGAPVLTLDKILSSDSILLLSKYILSDFTPIFGQGYDVANEMASNIIMDQYNNSAFLYTLRSLVIHIPNNLLLFKPCYFQEYFMDLVQTTPKKAASEFALRLGKIFRISFEGNGINAYEIGAEEPLMTCEYRTYKR